MADLPEHKVCITGIGQTPAGRPSNRTALQLTLDACLEAIADAGLKVDDIDIWELNEAFASQCLYSRDRLGIDRPVVSQPYYNLLNRMPEAEHLPPAPTTGSAWRPTARSPVAC